MSIGWYDVMGRWLMGGTMNGWQDLTVLIDFLFTVSFGFI